MTLGELLQYLRESILNDRSDRTAGTSDYLWTDENLVVNINEAQARFARRGLVLRDGSTNSVTLVTLEEGVSEYPLHDSVLGVLSAKLTGQQADLTRVGHAALAAYRAPTDNWVDPLSVASLPDGRTIAYSTDEALSSTDADTFIQPVLRVYPTPSADEDGDTIRLRVVRKPLVRFTTADTALIPEIPEDYHLAMLDWAAYLALRVVDDDAGAPKRAAEFAASFEQHVREARVEVLRKLFAPMGWGHGRGGWAWSN
jgi:hypothetical protein